MSNFSRTQRLTAYPTSKSYWQRLLFDADIFFLLLCIVFVVGLIWVESGKADSTVPQTTWIEADLNEVQAGSLLFTTNQRVGMFSAPLVDTRISSKVSGIVADVSVTQTFHNPTQTWIEGLYAFPLPHNASIYAMQMQIGDRIIEAQIKEKAQARKVYERAKMSGQKAALLVQSRPNLFTTKAANIAAGENVIVKIQYQQSLGIQSYANEMYYELRIPTTFTFPYLAPPNTSPAKGLTLQARQAGATGGVKPPQSSTDPLHQVLSAETDILLQSSLHDLRIDVELLPGFNVEKIISPSHPVLVTGPDNGRFSVALEQDAQTDKDYTLRWYLAPGEDASLNIISEVRGNDAYHLVNLLPPQEDSQGGQPLPRESIYIVDVSGSMHGLSLTQAKKALMFAIEHLRSQDKFNIVAFSDEARVMFAQPREVSQDNLVVAKNFISDLEAEGGTEMSTALDKVFGMETSEGYVTQVIFLTDGAVSNEADLFQMIHRQLGPRRLFTIGIGSAPNSYFMVKAAKFGRGDYTLIANENDVQEKMFQLFQRLENPILSDLLLRAPENVEVEYWPRRIPDLYSGQPLSLVVKTPVLADITLEVSGLKQNTQWQAKFNLAQATAGTGISRLWARKKIDSLMDELTEGASEDKIRAEVLALALDHKLASKYTSFVAVDVTPERDAADTLKTARYSNMPPFGSQTPQAYHLATTATSAEFRIFIGMLLLAIVAIYMMIFLPGFRISNARS